MLVVAVEHGILSIECWIAVGHAGVGVETKQILSSEIIS
jgi:hypothetical protein